MPGTTGGAGAPDASIHVVCRFRPLHHDTQTTQPPPQTPPPFQLDVERSSVDLVIDTFDRKSFTFDKLFRTDCTQGEVFESLSAIVDSIMEGYNGTIFAYGQTGSGKSHTMEGPNIWDMEQQGTIPRSVDRIFSLISQADSHLQFQVVLSYYEIYCEKIRDLLNPAQDNLKLRETKADGFVVQDVSEHYCTNRDDVLRLLELGKTYRQTAPTLMNAESSRSHSILSIFLDQKDTQTGRQKKGRLFLVDLAGSEQVSKTGASGLRLEEAKNINSSLTTLGMVITALTNNSSHIPYRDSKLTRLLQDALGGNSKTCLVICCAPELRHLSETVSTLRFGERAKRIQNKAKVNEEVGVEELKAMLAAARREIAALKEKERDSAQEPVVVAAAAAEEADGGARSELDEGAAVAEAQDRDNDRLAAEALAEMERLTAALQEAWGEAAGLRVRIATLEEEVEVERAGANLEREAQGSLRAELAALQATIADLEAKLLRAALDAKNISPPASADKSRSQSHSHGQGGSGSHSSHSIGASSLSAQLDDEAAPADGQQQDRDGGGTRGEGGGGGGEDRGADRSASADAFLQRHAEQALHGEARELLAEEIRSLESNLASKDSEARSAQQSAVNYADKYARLRDDYETHVQRLMMKLTREQQARIQAEDSLEDALQRLWSDEEEKKNAGGFFSLFSSSGGGSGSSSSSSRRDGEKRSLSARERSLARSLDIAQSRAFQLAAEFEANKEAHAIVLDTKESVMRSLVKQNAHLTSERDALRQRADDLGATVEQLTGLLRSSASRKSVPGAGAAGGRAAGTTISGGGLH